MVIVMKPKTHLACLLCLLMVLALAACGAKKDNPTPDSALSDDEIIDCVVDNFSLLANIPRPSHHEERISAFFVDWAKQQGLSPTQDEARNVIFDVPPTDGMEKYPLGILQVHMDMVVAVAEDKDFDPLTDPITVIRDDRAHTLTADGTSLGGDDGAGCALMMAVVQGKIVHGPLRVIITVDEEDGMEGAFHLDKTWLQGAAYLINLDNEMSDQVLVSTAAGDSIHFTATPKRNEPHGNLALTVQLSGLTGGHSGVEIDKGRLNALIGLADCLKTLSENDLGFELASFEGGTALNAIPTKATCTIVIDQQDLAAVQTQLQTYFDSLKETYAGIEDGVHYEVREEASLPQIISAEEQADVIRFLTEIIDGVYTWSADMEGLVESSSNLGLFALNEDGLSCGTYIRSSVGALEKEILDAQLALAEHCGYATEVTKMADPWPYDPNSKLLALTKEIYKEQNGKDIIVSALHAGLECGTFKLLSPEHDMISIGPDIQDAHTINETLALDSLPTVWRLLEALLNRVGA